MQTDKITGRRYQMNGRDYFDSSEPATEQRPMITVNIPEFKLSWGQVWKALTLVGGLIATAQAAGWMWPTQSEFKSLQTIVETVQKEGSTNRQETGANRDAIAKLIVAVDNLSSVVDRLQQAPPKVIERETILPAVKPPLRR